MTLAELVRRLEAFAEGHDDGDALRGALLSAMVADPLDIEASEAGRWDAAPHDERLFWRLVYLFESAGGSTDAEQRRTAARIVRCLTCTASSATTFDLLPMVLDQERFTDILVKHASGIISRTGFLSVLAESGYPDHVKLWLAHAPPKRLTRLVAELGAGHYDRIADEFQRAPDEEGEE